MKHACPEAEAVYCPRSRTVPPSRTSPICRNVDLPEQGHFIMTARLAIVGAGTIGSLHANSAAGLGVPVVAACDPDRDKAARLLAENGSSDGLATDRLETLLEDRSVDAVVIASPNRWHHEHALRCIDAGKAVLLEKPMAMTAEQCAEIHAAAKRAGVPLQIGFVCRFAPAVAMVRSLIESGRLGEIYHIKAMLYRRRGIPGLGKWFTTRSESGGGVLIDIGVHVIDLALHLLGHPKPQRVSGICESRFGSPIEGYIYDEMWAGPPDPAGTFDVEDAATGLIRCAGGCSIEFNVTWAANLPERLIPDGVIVLGSKGGCSFDIWGQQITITDTSIGRLADAVLSVTEEPTWPAAWRDQHEAFRSVVADGKPAVADGTHGRTVQAVVDAIYRSSHNHREVEINC